MSDDDMISKTAALEAVKRETGFDDDHPAIAAIAALPALPAVTVGVRGHMLRSLLAKAVDDLSVGMEVDLIALERSVLAALTTTPEGVTPEAVAEVLKDVTPKVRPLEFVYGVAESIVGNYLIDSGWKDKVGGERWWAWAGPISGESDPFYAWQHGTRADDEKAAKAAAQAHFDAAIRGEVILTPAPDAAAIREAALREAAAEIQRWWEDNSDSREPTSLILALLRKGGE